MAECCGSPKPVQKDSECCCADSERNVLVYACSGGANVGEIADRAGRELAFEGRGKAFCLAGLGGDIQGMVQTARDADMNLVIDGCPLDCAKKVFDRHLLSNYMQIRVTDLGIEKVKGVRCTAEQVSQVVKLARARLAEPLSARGQAAV